MSQTSQIVYSPGSSERIRHAAADFQRYLSLATGTYLPLRRARTLPDGGIRFVLGFRGDSALGDALLARELVAAPHGADGYALRRVGDLVAIVGADEAGAVYGVYALLEEAYGCGFFLGSEVIPAGTAPLLPPHLDLSRAPAFATRGLLPWYDFLSGPTAWNLEDYQLYIDRMVRMGLNFLGLHVYSEGSVNRSGGAEPFLSFTYRGVGHDAYLDTTQTSRWGYQPMRTSVFAYGTDQVFAGEVFGAEAAIAARGPLDAAARAKSLLSDALSYAKRRGLKICVGFEPAAVPEETLRALPSNAKRSRRDDDGSLHQVLDLSSVVAHDVLRIRLDDLLTTYPAVDAIWLWQNEDAAWALQRPDTDTLPFDVSYLRAAYDYLRQRAPGVQLVISGWGAVHQLFDQMHQELPSDIAFSALHHNLGTSETAAVYGRLKGRSRWPIPWLEDDATLWQPQYHVGRFHNDIVRARQFGADGMIGIHWRTRVIDHNASYFARSLWQPDLSPDDFYQWYGQRLAGQEQGPKLGATLTAIDQSHHWPGYLDDRHVGSTEWSGGHSNEAGKAFSPLPTAPDVVEAFSRFVEDLQTLASSLPDEASRERLRYHLSQAAFSQHYVVSQQEAAAIDTLVQEAIAGERKLSAAELSQARDHLERLFAAVRQAVETFAAMICTTADLGVLASLNQKYVQRAIWQRVDAIRQVAVDPSAVPEPDLAPADSAGRLFVPVPPDSVTSDGVGLQVIVQNARATAVSLHMASLSGEDEETAELTRLNRGVWRGTLRGRSSVIYWIEATTPTGTLRAPEAPDQTYSAIALPDE